MSPRTLSICAALFVFCGWFSFAAAQTVIRVDSRASTASCGGSLDGASWACAYDTLQDGLAAATAGSEVWVADGTYRPDEGSAVTAGDRTVYFEIPDGVAVYGGFDGSEVQRSDRTADPAQNGTILSGNVNAAADSTDNSHYVAVFCNAGSNTVLDGLTVEGAFPSTMLLSRSARTKRATVCSSEEQWSAGILVVGGAPTIRNVEVRRNTAAYGGGIEIIQNATPLIENVVARGNLGRSEGGGLRCVDSAPTLRDSAFLDNVAGDAGSGFPGTGAGILFSSCDGRVNRITVHGNVSLYVGAGIAGGIAVNGGTPTLNQLTVHDNSAGLFGGGVMLQNTDALLIGADIRGNEGTSGGSGLYLSGGSPTVVNTLVAGNVHRTDYGGSVLIDGGAARLVNVTVAGNQTESGTLPAGIVVRDGASVEVANAIVWGNTTSPDGAISVGSASMTTVRHSIVEGGFEGTAIKDASPLFANPRPASEAPTTGGSYLLTEGSPALDAGDASALPQDTPDLDDDGNATEPLPFDLGSNARFNDNNSDDRDEIDLGAYEAPSSVQPVEMAAFGAHSDGFRAVLQWTTATETDNAGFEVHRRSDGTWNVLGFVDGAGTAVEVRSYRFRTDPLPPGAHVFRLRQVDVDGTSALTDTVRVLVSPAVAALTQPAPNPFGATTQLRLSVRQDQLVRAVLFDNLGRRLRTMHDGPVRANGELQLRVDGTALASGSYWLRVTGSSFSMTRKLVVVR